MDGWRRRRRRQGVGKLFVIISSFNYDSWENYFNFHIKHGSTIIINMMCACLYTYFTQHDGTKNECAVTMIYMYFHIYIHICFVLCEYLWKSTFQLFLFEWKFTERGAAVVFEFHIWFIWNLYYIGIIVRTTKQINCYSLKLSKFFWCEFNLKKCNW